MPPLASLTSNRSLVLAVLITSSILTIGEIHAQPAPMRQCLNAFLIHRRAPGYYFPDTRRQIFCTDEGMVVADNQEEEEDRVDVPKMDTTPTTTIDDRKKHNELLKSKIVQLISSMSQPCKEFLNNIMSVFEGHRDSVYPYCQLMTFSRIPQLLAEISYVTNDFDWTDRQDKLLFKPLAKVDECMQAISSAQRGMDRADEQLVLGMDSYLSSKLENEFRNQYLLTYLEQGPQVLTDSKEFRELWQRRGGIKRVIHEYPNIEASKTEPNQQEEAAAFTECRYEESCRAYVDKIKPVLEVTCMGEIGAYSLARAIRIDERHSSAHQRGEHLENVNDFIRSWRVYFGCNLYLLNRQYKTQTPRLLKYLTGCLPNKKLN